MKKSKLNKKKCQQILATLVMGMNFINTIAPMAEAAQKIPESTEHLTQIPTSEAKPLEYTVLPQALKFVDNLIFGRAEAGPITVTGNISVSELNGPNRVEILSGGSVTADTMIFGGRQYIYAGGKGTVHTVIDGIQFIYDGGIGTIDNMNGGNQTISGTGKGTVNTMISGGQTISAGGTGIIRAMDIVAGGEGHQTISAGGEGIIENMNNGRQYISAGGKGTVRAMNGGGQIIYDGGIGTVDNMNGGYQTISGTGKGTVNTMISGGQTISAGGTGIIRAMDIVAGGRGYQTISAGGEGIIENMNNGRQYISAGGKGTVSAMNGGSQNVYTGGTSLDTNLYGGIQMVYDSGTAKDTTINGGTAVMLGAGAVVENVKMTGGEYRLNADGDAYRVDGKFDFSGGNFDMTQDLYGNKTGTYETLGINDLQTGGGTFIMDTDLASEIDGDKIVLDNAVAGTSYIQVNDASLINGPVEGHKNLLLVTVNNGTAAFAGKELNNGGLWTVTPTIENGVNVTDAAGNVIGTADQWYLTHVVRAVNKDTQVLLDGADSSYALWRNTNDTLRKRLGDLRYRSNKTDGDGIWARYTGGKFGSGSFDGSYNMYQLGYDKSDNAKSTYGIAVESGTGRSDYDFGSSKDKLWSGSLYGTWYGDNGSYTDVVARIGQMDTDMKSYGDYPDKATAKSHVYSLSVEYGKTIELSKKAGTFIEPQAQFIVGRLGSSSYTTDRGNNVYLGGVNSYIGRIGFMAGQKTPDGNNVYFKASLLHEFGGSRDMHMKAANGETMSASREYGDSWFEVGLGTNIHLSKASYFYGDIERSFGGDIEKKWQINAGLRFAF